MEIEEHLQIDTLEVKKAIIYQHCCVNQQENDKHRHGKRRSKIIIENMGHLSVVNCTRFNTHMY